MAGILVSTAGMAIAFYAVWTYYISDGFKSLRKKENGALIIILCAAAFFIRAVCAVKYKGHETDMNCFLGWSDIIFNNGISEFYKGEGFHDYPPGYMYVLYIIGAIKNLINPGEGGQWLLVKLPAIICDIAAGVLIYKISTQKTDSQPLSAVIAALYMLNPAVVLNSSLWGQVDSVYALFVLYMLYLLTEKRLITSYFVFALCIFIKPQAFMFFPLIVFAIAENIFMPGFDSKLFTKNLLCGLSAVAIIVVLALPFGFGEVVNQYITTLSSYPYMTVNAFNIWGAFGQNWTGLNTLTSVFGYVMLAVIVAAAAYVFFKTSKESKYYFTGALISFATFMLSVKMHDRYAFPAMVLLLAAMVVNRDSRSMLLYAFMSISQFFNTAWVLFIYEQDINKYFKSPVIVAASWINIAYLILFAHTAWQYYVKNKELTVAVKKVNVTGKAKKTQTAVKETQAVSFMRSRKFEKLNRFDYIFIASVMIVYGVIAFYKLGDMKAPQTFINVGSNNAVTVDLGEEKDISSMMMYLGSYNLDDNRTLEINYLDSERKNVKSDTLTSGAVFFWSDIEADARARYITLHSSSENLTIMELCIQDSDKNIITPANSTYEAVANIFDEQDLKPERQSFMNSTYFDEIYHGRTAYEFIHGLDVYEWTHPPLGKIFIAIGIKLFGMVPFGWRFTGTLFGILMIPVIYIFARRFFGHQWLAMLTCLFLTFDFMHFAQSRISTIDVYVTFFIMLMYLFMYKYRSMSFYDTPLKKTFIPLGLCGICMGLGIATKWTGVYAGAGLAVLFFMSLYKRYTEYLHAKSDPKGSTDGIEHEYVIRTFAPNVKKTIIFCCIFFAVIPVAIYMLSYIPYLRAPGSQGLKTIIENQESMFTYHSKTVVNSTHPFASRWYEWIIMRRPIWFYSGTITDEIKEGISSFGNPAVWWAGIPAFIYMLYLIITKKDKNAFFLAFSYLAQLISWIPVTRTTYIYHYFPSVPFVVMMVGYCIFNLYESAKNNSAKKAVMYSAFGYTAVVIGLFMLFYPVLSGQPCNVEFAQKYLKWFDTWALL